ncbi:hypothetical protein SDRG_07953 [Saprolegnia diclina VS20]|uniref:phosphatidylinositol 3-kinase n=1 Tax=Saprolegnia diclina (strain VS20) TaxID=1156394 RepID=T0RWC0_SAPDV|nr:hypothetical protein SDRG_07953 [Saprolegnia diclina VS20]EQC34632.1 hypothetical protein SDRG_07953 [Saprolegnia diclina VS20]|eukprot:XP_008612038.1 hypothetical protein SDRG_07953 [Saprolegnia diclina VS20]
MPPQQLLQHDKPTGDELFHAPELVQAMGSASELQNSAMNELFVSAQIFADGLPMHTMPICTKSPSKVSASCLYWNEWITLPVKFRDLPRNAVIALTIWGVGEVPVGGTTVPLFGRNGLLKDGALCLRVWPRVAADPDVLTTTPSDYEHDNQAEIVTRQMECFRLDKLKERYDRHEMLRLDWVDRITNRRIARMRSNAECPGPKEEFPSYIHVRNDPCLWIDLPYFGHPVVYEEEPYPIRNANLYGDAATRPPASLAGETPAAHPRSLSRIDNTTDSALVAVWDPDLAEDNPAERKYRKLARDILRGSIDPNLKPNREEKFRIDKLLGSSSDHLKNDEKDLLWKFRYTLVENRKAIVKFLLSVDWLDETEVTLTSELLTAWTEIDVADALKLLGPRKEFRSDLVRHFAVAALDKARNEELLDFLLQLVQALRYERRHEASLGPLARFLISRACKHFKMANFFYWYLQVEVSDVRDGDMFTRILERMLSQMRESDDGVAILNMLQTQNEYMNRIMALHLRARDEKGKKDAKEEKLKQYLKQMVWPKGVHIRLPLDPSIHLSGIVPTSAKMFKSAMYPCVLDFTTVLVEADVAEDTEATSLRESLSVLNSGPSSFTAPPPLTSMTSNRFLGLRRDKDGPAYKVMIKNGDDLRQDQLVMQMFSLMDRLLKKVNLDLKLVSYQILATSPSAGLMMFVNDSYPVSGVISNYKTIQAFLRAHNPDPSGYEGIALEAINTYVRSLAGSCVFSYILGIGDRHLENVMMKSQGHLFHIDFGFIFGADPKPFPPPFKLTKEMVEGMGGTKSEHYNKFETLCCQAYNWLRKSAPMILNLLHLMVDAGIEGYTNDPQTVLAKVEERFRLDLTDEQAEQFFLQLISDSMNALFPVLADIAHDIRVKMR